MNKIIKACGYASALILMANTAHAAPSYCSGNTDGLSLSDMTYGVDGPAGSTSNATDCYGKIEAGHLGSNGGNTTASIINQLWGSQASLDKQVWGTGDFVELVKKNTGETGPGNTVLGYTWSLDGSLAATSGIWTLTASPLDGLPMYFDFVGVLKGSNASAAYLFDEAPFDGSSGGSWTISFPGPSAGPNPPIPTLSNLTIYGRLGSTEIEDPANGIPEPGVLAIFGTGLLGLGLIRRRKFV